ncbi:MAG TPA: serine/threonine-protein kinase [Gemmatimonadaceae bacterium]|nr:serine/threonine-protein kinase [Gemmatimonadaceae bacterium]
MTHPSAEFLDLQAALAGEYSLQRELGRGGMGIVYLARDVQLDRDVAIKVLPTPLARTAAARERFLREARTAAGLSHPHIVPIHRVGEAGGFVFFVMSYVEGETLGERIRTRGPLPPSDTMRVMREVAWALAYAHGRGIVHRDVKPDNILLEAGTGRALVTDFGIARAGGDPEHVTDEGRIMGTAHFMSPEQAASGPLDGRSDIYSLGVVGYLAVSGRLPFESRNLPALLVKQATEVAPSVMRAAPGLPSALGAAIDRCLARDPASRFADGEALAEALAPAADPRPALPATLRAWLAARNPLLVPYMGWCAAFGTLTLANLIAWVTGNRPDGPADIVLLTAITSLPLFPIVGFHLNQARRQFRAGHTLADLRTALEIARRERAETDALALDGDEPFGHRLLRLATVGAGTWLAVTVGLLLQGTIHENRVGIQWILGPVLTTMALGAVSNALDVQFIPARLREWWQTGIRDRLWKSRAGEWLARRLGAPERSQLGGASMFRATEAALGVAASELFAALPKAYREQLSDLPATVAALEARAADARAAIDVLAAMAPSGTADAEILAARREAAAAHLAESVAALEGIRLDLLRLHAGAVDLAPLTTLLDAARVLGEDVSRLADAQRDADDVAGHRLGARRIPTPA